MYSYILVASDDKGRELRDSSRGGPFTDSIDVYHFHLEVLKPICQVFRSRPELDHSLDPAPFQSLYSLAGKLQVYSNASTA